MGRTVGANAEETRRRPLRAAADVFAARGFDGTRVSDIAGAAGLSNSALYCYFTSRADLLIGALRAHGRRPLADLVARFPTRSVADLLLQTGAALRRRQEPESFLAVEALIAARHHGQVATALRAPARSAVRGPCRCTSAEHGAHEEALVGWAPRWA